MKKTELALAGTLGVSGLLAGISRLNKVEGAFDVDYLIDVKEVKGGLKHFKRIEAEQGLLAEFVADKDIKHRTKVGELLFIPDKKNNNVSKRLGVKIPLHAIRRNIYVDDIQVGDKILVLGFNNGEISVACGSYLRDRLPKVELGSIEEVNYFVDGTRKVAKAVAGASAVTLGALALANYAKKLAQ